MANIGDITQLPSKLTQNTLDFWAKQIQTFVDAYFGTDNDNSNEAIIIPFTLDCYVPFTTQSAFTGGVGYLGGHIHTVIPLTDTDDYFVEWFLDSRFSSGAIPYLQAYADGCHLRVAEGYNPPVYMDRPQASNSLFVYDGSNKQYYAFQYQYVYRDNNISNDMPTLNYDRDNSVYIDYSGLGEIRFTQALRNYTSLSIKPDKTYPTVCGGGTSDFNNAISNIYNNSTYNNTYNYTTNNGDTITTYYGDNYINYDYSNKYISYNDFYNITNQIINDLGVELGVDWNGDNTPLHFPSYEEIKYIDMGDFYIEPLHQYDKIPVVPAFDGAIDLADYPTVLAEGANTFLNFMPATLSALFTAAFVACVLLRKLGR